MEFIQAYELNSINSRLKILHSINGKFEKIADGLESLAKAIKESVKESIRSVLEMKNVKKEKEVDDIG